MKKVTKVTYICTKCGSEDVQVTNHLMWDMDEQQWTVVDDFNDPYCPSCKATTGMNEVPYTSETV